MYGVYIVDDERLIINHIVDVMAWQENGFEVVGTHTNPITALDEIFALKPHVVFCDLKMPGMDGITLMQRLRATQMDCELVMLSAFGEFEASRSFFLMDGFDYLLKPLKVQEAEIVLEKLSRKLSEKEDRHPTTTFCQTQMPVFDELVAYVTENFNKKLSLDKLSARFNISTSYICTLFSKYYASTLTIFVTNLRMKEAAGLIANTDMPFKEVAVSCGYTDYFYFCRVFKGYHDASPTEYRQQARRGQYE